MIIIDQALARREAEGKPIRVGLVGTGFMGAGIVRQIVTATKGMRIVAVANRHIATAIQAVQDVGIEPLLCDSAQAISRVISSGYVAVTRDGEALASADGIDVVVEVTGSIDYAAGVVLAAISAGKHVVQMNAELDGTVGPILYAKARSAGVTYTFSDGDQPGVQMNLLRFVQGIGVTPVMCGNIKGLHDPHRTPETQRAFAEKWGQKPVMVSSFADGCKISYEQAIVANGTGFRVAQRGMVGLDFSGGDPTAPLFPLDEALPQLVEIIEEHGEGLVDYVVGCRPAPGVFVIGRHDDPRQRHFLNLYKLGPGPYYCFQTPYHLCHFEVPNSIARVCLFGDSVLAPTAGPRVGVVAAAKKDLRPGDTITEFGGFEAYGVAENYDVIERDRLLPMGIALDATLIRPVPKDHVLTYADVSLPKDRLIDNLYAQQSRRFGHNTLAA
ncbi:NAD(P)-dependent oxidoreductase [Sphingomonas cannabina]|uniref:NAD(P)H-dependent oxidoreductase n=1 Tax=Sphingomonas cannabina TaxID=2899123 RepID=UPI001F1B649E|nr:Gfo/Idh/MocA family oxidoreductase [Sphingomonas cannabina]UIJ44006.1 NAD(P)-dependent oxidoreductase [Sphingomonas cannabina]